ncbi:sialin-like [Bacillus rossius redtenbacheri]|uniref:sialin-like n=1 Tax=Bacillus rossius redtenbacheri TaxID=93214 RepID=UPI002FDE89E0
METRESINTDGNVPSDEELLVAPNSSREAVEDTTQWFKTRYALALMGFLGFANVYAMRVNLSVAIVTMVNNSAIPHDNTSSFVVDTCPIPIANETKVEPDGRFVWDEKTQGLILGCFFYGYIVTQVPGGRLADRFGGKLVFGLGVLLTGVFTVLSPLAAELHTGLFVAIRILEGLSEGVTFPAIYSMLAHWVPPLDRAKFAAYVYSGSNFGTIVSMPVSGYLCDLDFLDGWPLSFYLFGSLSILWFIAWIFVAYDTPESHPRISCAEKNYIISSIGSVSHKARRKVPWMSILTSLPLWAILVSNCGQSWAFYTQLMDLPTYLKNILHFDVKQNGVLTSLPSLSAWGMGIGFSYLASWLLHHNYISILNSHKLFNTIASVVPSLGLVAVAWVGCNREAVTILLVAAGAFGGASYAGNQMNHMALSPHYAGTMYGITNAAGNVCGFLAPYAIGVLIDGKDTLVQWQKVFYIAGAVNIAGSIFYLVFASATEQPWSIAAAKEDESDAEDDDEEPLYP